MRYVSWNVLNKLPADPIVAVLLARNILDKDSFVSPKYENLSNPHDFKFMSRAVARVKKATSENQRIGLFMDYDADGICGGAIIYRNLSKFVEIEYYVPHRSEGYGLSKKAIDSFIKSDCNLILTVDCGIKNNEEIAYAKSLGIDTIVIDHHELPDELPDAYAIIHPQISPRIKFKTFSGGGVAYNFVRALGLFDGKEKWDIDLAAISTVADIVPLVEDNRVIVSYGLGVIAKTRNKGLGELIKISSLDKTKIGTYEVGFQIAPRINATGRIDDPVSSFKLLTSNDKNEIAILCEKLNRLNSQRQDVLKKDLASVDGAVKSENKTKNEVIIIERDGLNEGVVGLVAGKITDLYYKPSIVLTDRDGFYKGSARSIRGVNITEIISSASDLLESYGGHPGAAGLSLKKENLKKFEDIINKEGKKIDKKLFDRVLQVDALIDSSQINLELARSIEHLEPFGYGNSRPTFALERMKIANLKAVGKTGDHYKIMLCDSVSNHECIAFNVEKNGWKIEDGMIVDVAFSISINRWRDREKVDLIVEDIKSSKNG